MALKRSKRAVEEEAPAETTEGESTESEDESTETTEGESADGTTAEPANAYGEPTPPATVDPVKAEEAKKWHNQAKDSRKRLDEASFEMAEALYKIHDGALYTALGHDSFRVYVEQEVDFQMRKAQYFVALWGYYGVKYAGSPALREKIRLIGWTKAKELIGVVTPENVDEWIVKAQSMSALALIELARKILQKKVEGQDSNDTPTGPDFKTKTFRLEVGDQYDIVARALKKAGQIGNTDEAAAQIGLVCQDFLATNGGEEDLQPILRRLEAMTGKLLIMIDPKTKIAVYGEENLQVLTSK